MGTTEIAVAGVVATAIAISAIILPPAKHLESEAVHLLMPKDALKPMVNNDELRLDAVQENLELQSVRIQKLSQKLDALIVVKERRDERPNGGKR